MRNIFVDTNVFLHLRPIGDLPANEICDGKFALWVPNKVIEELDKHKDSSDQKLKKRARSALKLIESLESGSCVLKNGISLNWYQKDPVNKWDDWGLDKTRGDDVIIATMLTFQAEHQGKEVGILARDSAIRMRAGRFGLAKISTKTEHEQPEELDEDKKEIERLRREIVKHQARQPKFKVGLGGLGKVQEPARLLVHYSKAKHLDAEAVDELVNQEEVALDLFPEMPISYYSNFGHAHMFEPSVESKKKYNQDARRYLNDFRRFLTSVANAYFQRMALTIPVHAFLSNIGTSSATNVDLRLKFPVGIIGGEFPAEPKAPVRPARPKGVMESFGADLSAIRTPSLGNFMPPRLAQDGDAKIRVLGKAGFEVSYNFEEIKHHEKGKCEKVFLTFQSAELAKSFQIHYEITCRELVDKVGGGLDVVVEVD